VDKAVQIIEILSIEEHKEELSKLLKCVVDDGASIGFLPPLDIADAESYWEDVTSPGVVLFVAVMDGRIAGTVQLHLCRKQNGAHRAEIAKLIMHPDYRRLGIGRALMHAAEQRAVQEGRSLLVLDTREGDPSNELYRSIGYIHAGRIPGFAISANGGLDATVLYYKNCR